MTTKTYKDLVVWQKATELVVEVYSLTESFPKEEIFGLTSQLRRAAVSISSNIAEGKLRGSDPEFKRFLLIAYGSAGEVETQINIAKRLRKTANLNYIKVDTLLEEVLKILNVIINKLTPKA